MGVSPFMLSLNGDWEFSTPLSSLTLFPIKYIKITFTTLIKNISINVQGNVSYLIVNKLLYLQMVLGEKLKENEFTEFKNQSIYIVKKNCIFTNNKEKKKDKWVRIREV